MANPLYALDIQFSNFKDPNNHIPKIVPVSGLDNILKYNTVDNINYKFYSFLSGEVLRDEDRLKFYEQIKLNIKNKTYPTIDHLPIHIQFNNYNIIYISLDNSFGSNICGFPLKDRLPNICFMVNNIIDNCENGCIVFFSESCRSSFDGKKNNRKNEVKWFKMKNYICKMCDLYYLTECASGDDPDSFGISAFCTKNYMDNVDDIIKSRICTKVHGSATVGIKFITGEIVWAIHFPVDFRSKERKTLV